MEQVKREPADPLLRDWLTISQAAEVAGVTVETVREWIRLGKVEVFYFGPETETVH